MDLMLRRRRMVEPFDGKRRLKCDGPCGDCIGVVGGWRDRKVCVKVSYRGVLSKFVWIGSKDNNVTRRRAAGGALSPKKASKIITPRQPLQPDLSRQHEHSRMLCVYLISALPSSPAAAANRALSAQHTRVVEMHTTHSHTHSPSPPSLPLHTLKHAQASSRPGTGGSTQEL
jgi:hypothetical protein